MLAAFQDGWALDWLKQAFTPGVALAFIAVSVLTWRAATDYGRLSRLEQNMVTKDGLQLAIQEMEVRLQNRFEERFLDKQEHDSFSREQDLIHGRQNEDIKYLLEREREANRGGALRPYPSP